MAIFSVDYRVVLNLWEWHNHIKEVNKIEPSFFCINEIPRVGLLLKISVLCVTNQFSTEKENRIRKAHVIIVYFRLGLVATIKVWNFKGSFKFDSPSLLLQDYAGLNINVALFGFVDAWVWVVSAFFLSYTSPLFCSRIVEWLEFVLSMQKIRRGKNRANPGFQLLLQKLDISNRVL